MCRQESLIQENCCQTDRPENDKARLTKFVFRMLSACVPYEKRTWI